MTDNITVLDSDGVERTVRTTDTAGVHTPHHIVSSSALPDGAATAARQAAPGTAGSPSADVTTVQGVSGGTPIPVNPGTDAASLGKAEDAAHQSGDVGVMALAVRQGAPDASSSADGDYEPLKVRRGRLLADAEAPTLGDQLAEMQRTLDALLAVMCAAFGCGEPDDWLTAKD